jgi:hypothetical protein
MFAPNFIKTTGIVCLALIALVGCRPEEQNRVYNFEPGVLKQKDPSAELTEAELAELRQRSILQGGIIIGHTAAGATTAGTDVRPPSPSNANKELIERGKLQGSGN